MAKKRTAAEEEIKSKTEKSLRAFMAGDMKATKENLPHGLLLVDAEQLGNDFIFEPDYTDPSDIEIIR